MPNRFPEAAAMMAGVMDIGVMDICEEVLAPDHPYPMRSRKSLATIQQAIEEMS